MTDRTVLKANAGESIGHFAKRLVAARPARGEFNGIELDVPDPRYYDNDAAMLADALGIIYSLSCRIRELEKQRGGW
jgi:hypothetical protein